MINILEHITLQPFALAYLARQDMNHAAWQYRTWLLCWRCYVDVFNWQYALWQGNTGICLRFCYNMQRGNRNILPNFVAGYRRIFHIKIAQAVCFLRGGNLKKFFLIYTGRFIMFSVITNIYNKKTKGPNLMELFTVKGKRKKVLSDN
jgi:hypothetical protein